ncbi:MAG: DUF7577 domain-containing protein [Janthinobacterium lividum]
MSRVKSPTAVCPECGTTNPADARFCVRCAARLGAEPSIVAPRLSAPSRSAGAGAIPSRPAPLAVQRADTTTFWVKLGIGGLLLLIGFVCWSVYILTDVKTVPQMPTGQGGATAGVVLAPVVAVPAAPSTASLPSSAVPAASTAASSVSNAASGAGSSTAPIAVVPAAPRVRATPRSASRAVEENAAVSGGWVEPSRPPAMTSSPAYQDAGPPIVRGPEPRETAPVPVTVPSQGNPAPDLGPPVVEGPGPRYDYSRSGGTGR